MTTFRRSLATVLAFFSILWLRVSPAQAAENDQVLTLPVLKIAVDPRVELMSLIFRLAGNREYNMGRVKSYSEDVDRQFGKFKDHRVVKMAARLRNSRGVSYDAVMAMAVHLSDVTELRLRQPLKPWPDGLDQRWPEDQVQEFLRAAREFVRESGFGGFLAQHQELYRLAEKRMRELMRKEAHLDWYGRFFGERPKAQFTLFLGMLNGGGCYGPHCRDANGTEELYCVLGVWQTDSRGLPEFTADMLGTVVHEFCHSFANPIIEMHEAELRAAGKKIYRHVAERMRAQAYGNAGTMLRESLVRACTVRFLRQYDGLDAARRAAQAEADRGFAWTGELAELLAQYEEQRAQYPTLDSFAPRLVEFFKQYAEDFDKKQTALASQRPKVLAITPANGAQDVGPDVTEIKVVFDRPMQDGSWAMCGGGPHYPETPGKPHYDAARTTWTTPVKLKPNWSYEFWLNAGRFDAFRSAEGVPLEPVHVTFKTTERAAR